MSDPTKYGNKTDLTFFTNEEGSSLLSRFKSTLKDTQLFDVLVGYFRASGFYQLYDSLELQKFLLSKYLTPKFTNLLLYSLLL